VTSIPLESEFDQLMLQRDSDANDMQSGVDIKSQIKIIFFEIIFFIF
jgi:hypothetical protein